MPIPRDSAAPLINLKEKRKLRIRMNARGKFSSPPLFKDQNKAKTKKMKPPKCKVWCVSACAKSIVLECLEKNVIKRKLNCWITKI